MSLRSRGRGAYPWLSLGGQRWTRGGRHALRAAARATALLKLNVWRLIANFAIGATVCSRCR